MRRICRPAVAAFVFVLGVIPAIRAQELLVPAGFPALPADHVKKSAGADVAEDTLELPFFDDFSNSHIIPHPGLWKDRYVYINNSYSRDPVTIGIATFDAVDLEGNLNGSTRFPFPSDSLTSRPVNLNYPGRQDIWLSFFYEPKGLGDEPEEGDSLIVEFLAPDSSQWETVWSSAGFPGDTFRQVFIPVREDRFLKKGFQFRFVNYASLPRVAGYEDKNGNVDHWNIDYVYLDTARSSTVTALHDVSMISSLGSLLKTYQAMPWKHFFPKAYLQELESTVDVSYRNNDTTLRTSTRVLKITDLAFQYSDSVNGGAAPVMPGVLNTFQFPFNYPFVFYEADSAVFEVKAYLITEDQDYKWNDTVVRYQRFINYYAYDDGSAENGYGLRAEGTSSASVACLFDTYKTDTLRGVQMYFNRTLGDYSQNYFRLAVWDHDQALNAPGQLIYEMSGVRPEYPAGLNQFHTYILDTAIVVSDKFYVGWIKTTENMLNVGWDVWNNNQDKIFYNRGQGWVNTGFIGSLMIRPVLGKALTWPAKTKEIRAPELKIWPNPASDQFFLELPPGEDAGEWTIGLYNLQGKLVYSTGAHRTHGPVEGPYEIGDLPGGLFIVRVERDGIFKGGCKLMILR